MRKGFILLMCVAALALASSCAPRNVGTLKMRDASRKVSTVYVWDADGHIDLSLLTRLRADTQSYLALNGFVVSKDPNATQAYVKITVDDAVKGDGGFIRARLYVVDASDQAIIYDKTCDTGSDSDGYPVARFVECALGEFGGKPGTGE